MYVLWVRGGDGKFYVGKTTGTLALRRSAHLSDAKGSAVQTRLAVYLRGYLHRKKDVQISLLQSWKLVDDQDEKLLDEREVFWIQEIAKNHEMLNMKFMGVSTV